MPSHWNEMKVTRQFRGATFEVNAKRSDVAEVEVSVDGAKIDGIVIKAPAKGKTYKVDVKVPQSKR